MFSFDTGKRKAQVRNQSSNVIHIQMADPILILRVTFFAVQHANKKISSMTIRRNLIS